VAETVPDLFYQQLFELAPQYRDLFKKDMEAQKRKFVVMLRFIVAALDWPEDLWAAPVSTDEDLLMVISALGRRHRDIYKVPDDAYPPVGEALLWTLDYGLGEAFTVDVRDAWLELYRLLSRCMIMSASLAGSGSVVAAEGR
jgi:hemoglobin-like flavoprotein